MCEEIKKHYDDILPEEVRKEVDERLKDIEVHQEEVVSNVKNNMCENFNGLNFI